MVGPPQLSSTVDAWEARHPGVRLPNDLRALVTEGDGIHLWACEDTGRAYFGLAPLAEWARLPELGPGCVVVSYHADGEAQIVVDAAAGTYFLVDTAGPDLSTPIAADVAALLDWLLVQRRQLLEPPDTNV